MKSSIFKTSIIFLFAISIFVFSSCEKDPETELEEELTGFEFPRVTYVDSLIYLEIQKTCKNYWDLSIMDSESLIILSYKNEYSIYCEGQQDNQYYWFFISTDLNGKWKNDGKSPYLGKGSIFNIKNLDKLKLEDFKGFWNENSTLESENSAYTMFESHPGFLNNYRISDENNRSVELSFFKTKTDAVEAMENKIESVAAVINQGTSTALPGIWWYSESPANVVFVSRWNVLLEIHINNSEDKPAQNAMYNTANEVLRRMSLVLD